VQPRYWLGTWDWDSWLVFQGLEPPTIGLPRRADISVGDIFLNYVKGERNTPGQWVSAERIVGPYRRDETQIYSAGVWPHRWPVERATPRYLAGDGLVAKDLIGGMEMFRGATASNWGSPLRMQGREIPRADGELLVDLLASGTPADSSVTGAGTLRDVNRAVRHTRSTRREIPLSLRYRILKRDGFRCVRCGRSPAFEPGLELHVDHILPWSRGGETTEENLQALCADCNLGKSNRHDG
jgi:hypothetical protein